MANTIRLTPRLRAAAELVPPGSRLCDVGTDHAHLPAALLEEGRIVGAIASDIRPGPLERARATAERQGLSEKIQLRLCPGLAAIRPEETDAVTICGMGGEMIAGILSGAPWTRDGAALILQPQRSQAELRRWLQANGYLIRAERLVAEGSRWYTVLLAEGGQDERPLTPGAALAGRPDCWVREEQRLPGLRAMLEKLTLLEERLCCSSRAEDRERLAEYQAAQKELRRWIEQLEKGEWPKW